ncbi:MAG: NAD(P)H-dependent oxidoreductase subunit E [Deltaproteobacteria bacterium]|nr:NAD(P)H-dependent oxidoreductase subunit E [Deltaproteobacteria bacterium]MBW2661802.1 NAD(P)H-dependent oxidoreductase subunit E [Deltaproteobacteria bacterium]
MKNTIKDIIKPYQSKKGSLIPILQAVQEKTGFISEEAISTIALELKMSEHEIYGVTTFYTQFRFTRPADHQIKVCLGTACHVKGNALNLQNITNMIGIKEGEITPDHRLGLETVNCLGACALAPLTVIDEKYYGNLSSKKLEKILAKYVKHKTSD